MGLDAIKNVGEGPVEAVLQARGGTAFKSLADFTDRCDLRKVNRRGLECLVKVGHVDDFSEKPRRAAVGGRRQHPARQHVDPRGGRNRPDDSVRR